MSRPILLSSVVVAAVALSACGDDEKLPARADAGPGPADAIPCVDPAAAEFPGGLMGEPSELLRAGCQSGSLAGLDPSGLWFITADPQRRFSAGPVRFTQTCEDGLSVGLASIASSTPIETVVFNDDDLFFYHRQEFQTITVIDAFDLCGIDGDGNLVGHSARCFTGDFGDQCGQRDIVVSPFGRLPGESEARGLELVSEYNGPTDAPWPDDFTANVAVENGIAYVARGGDAVRIVDVSDPANPAELSSFPAESDNYNDLALIESGGKTYLLIASGAFGVITLNVTDPANPVEVNRFAPAEGVGVHRLFTETLGAVVRVYLADGNGDTMVVFDVTDPTTPTRLGSYQTPDPDWGIHAAFAKDGIAYVDATVGGMLVVDVNDMQNPVELGRYTKDNVYAHASLPADIGGRKIVLYGDEGYASHLEVVDVDPVSPTFTQRIGELELRPEVSIHNARIIGDRAFIAHYQDGVRIVDLSDPTNPTLDSYFNTWDPATAPGGVLEGAVDLEVDTDGLIYLAETPRGLLILRETGN